MKYSTEQKKRSRLQGHRKRRRTFEVKRPVDSGVDWTEYKTMRQYRAVGSILDEFKTYGFRGGIENIVRSGTVGGCHGWLTEEPEPDKQ